MMQKTSTVVCEVNPEIGVETTTIKNNVLDEDSYTQEIDVIIERDFFPDLKKLRAQNEYLEAVAKNDVVKIRQMQAKYRRTDKPETSTSICSTPQTFETPIANTEGNNWETDRNEGTDQSTDNNKNNSRQKDLSLDKFLCKNTSEDNASFAKIMEVSGQKHREKHAWLYDKEREHLELNQKALTLPSIEDQNNETKAICSGSIDNWTYKNKNYLMYVPDGVKLSYKEIIEQGPGIEINHKNTRYTSIPFNELANKDTINETAAAQAKSLQGKIGVDGKEIIPQDTPLINGYGVVNPEPSPAPGVSESPLITWGEIKGTPFRLDGSDTPRSNLALSDGPSFRIPKVSKRDRLGHSLADDIGKKKRAKKEQALQHVRDRLKSASPMSGLNSPNSLFGRLSEMSPAARNLANKSLGISRNTDKSLRASYTPENNLPTNSNTPTPTSSTRSDSTPVSSLTDNLLNIPNHRMKASEFFGGKT